jgi:Condensin complex subunit 2
VTAIFLVCFCVVLLTRTIVPDSGTESNADMAGNPETVSKKSRSKMALPDIDFTKSLEKRVVASLFAPPKNPKSLLLPSSKAACSNMLPEDCHYRPDSLVMLFLLPDTMVISYFKNLRSSFLLCKTIQLS